MQTAISASATRIPAGLARYLIVLLLVVCRAADVDAQARPGDVFRCIDLSSIAMAKVSRSLALQDTAAALSELLRYYKTRTNRTIPDGIFDSAAHIGRARQYAAREFSFKGQSRRFDPLVEWRFTGEDREWNFTLNRMEWFIDLARAYELTRDESFVRAWMEQIESWIDMGDPGYPRTIDTGRRLEHLVFSHWMFVTRLHSPSVTPEFNARLLASIAAQCEFLYAPEHWRRYSNWGTFENSGLSKAAVMFPEFIRSPQWLKEIFFRMDVQLNYSFYGDGMHVELSPSYHLHELKMWYDFAVMIEANDVKDPWSPQNFPRTFREKAAPLVRAAASLVLPGGRMPQLGDTDDDDDTSLVLWSEFLKDPQLAFLASNGREGTPPSAASSAFPDAGYYLMRSGWAGPAKDDRGQFYLLFDATINKPWHAHRDMFSLVLSAANHDLLIDPGRYTYNEGPERDAFTRTSAHSTLVVNGQEQSKLAGKPDAVMKRLPAMEFVRGDRRQGAFAQSRSIYYLKPDYCVVVDKVDGADLDSVEQYWRLSPDALGRVTVEGALVVAPHLLIASSLPASSVSIMLGTVSRRYRETTPAPIVKYSLRQRRPVTIATVLFPYTERPPVFDVRFIERDSTVVGVRIRHGGTTDLLAFASDSLSIDGVRLSSDGSAAYVRSKAGLPGIDRFALLGGSALTVNGITVFASKQGPVDASSDGDRADVTGPVVSGFRALLGDSCSVYVNGVRVRTHREGALSLFE